MPVVNKNPPLEIRLRALAAVDYAKGLTVRERIKSVSQQPFVDQQSGITYQFTWRTIIHMDVMYVGFAGAKNH